MSNIKLVHSGGNSVSLTTPDSNPAWQIAPSNYLRVDGSAGEFLKTDGSGALSFATPTSWTTDHLLIVHLLILVQLRLQV